MNNDSKPDMDRPMNQEELLSALFANLVVQQTNMAFMFLGKVPHPETNQPIFDFESAKLIIDQLEMLRVKTRGNLNPREDELLKQSLTHLRMTFVEVINESQTEAGQEPQRPADPQTASPRIESAPPPMAQPPPPAPAPTPAAETDESRKKFSKKY